MGRDREREQEPEKATIDLHGRRPAEALAHLAQFLHGARLRGTKSVRVVTGRGWGNATWEPVLRKRVQGWLQGAEGRRMGVKGVRVVSRGGALDVTLS